MTNLSNFTVNAIQEWMPSFENLPALSIRQPYAWLVASGIKNIENRSRRTHYRGLFLIHASLKRQELTDEVIKQLELLSGYRFPETFSQGGIVGIAEIVDCVEKSDSPWKMDDYWGWVLANARPLEFKPCKGALGLFKPKWD